MIADDIRLPAAGKLERSSAAAQIDPDAPRITPQNVNGWRFWARTTEMNGQVILGMDLFMDMLDQIESGQP